jgi:hypothetical protein
VRPCVRSRDLRRRRRLAALVQLNRDGHHQQQREQRVQRRRREARRKRARARAHDGLGRGFDLLERGEHRTESGLGKLHEARIALEVAARVDRRAERLEALGFDVGQHGQRESQAPCGVHEAQTLAARASLKRRPSPRGDGISHAVLGVGTASPRSPARDGILRLECRAWRFRFVWQRLCVLLDVGFGRQRLRVLLDRRFGQRQGHLLLGLPGARRTHADLEPQGRTQFGAAVLEAEGLVDGGMDGILRRWNLRRRLRPPALASAHPLSSDLLRRCA